MQPVIGCHNPINYQSSIFVAEHMQSNVRTCSVIERLLKIKTAAAAATED